MEEQALRFNSGKPDWTILDYPSIEPAVRVMEYGAKKYTVTQEDGTVISGRDNWKKPCGDPRQHLQCAMRHLISIIQGQEIDPESGQPHSGHVICNMMMYNYQKEHYGK